MRGQLLGGCAVVLRDVRRRVSDPRKNLHRLAGTADGGTGSGVWHRWQSRQQP